MEELGANNWIEMYEKHDIQDKTDDSTSYAAHDAPDPLAVADPWASSSHGQNSPAVKNAYTASRWKVQMYEKPASATANDATDPLAAADPWAPSSYAQISPAQNTPAVSITHEPSRGKGKGKGK